jgi:hypothetical protein
MRALLVICLIDVMLHVLAGQVASQDSPCLDSTHPLGGTGGVVAQALLPQQHRR